jgi:hypothetical protein
MKTRKRTIKRKRTTLPAPRRPAVDADEITRQIARIFDGMSILVSKIEQIEGQLKPLTGLQNLPTRNDVEDVRTSFHRLRIYAEQAREKIAGLIDGVNFPRGEFVTRSDFHAWKSAFDERLTAVERNTHTVVP